MRAILTTHAFLSSSADPGLGLIEAFQAKGLMSKRNGNRSNFNINRKRRLALRARQRAIKAALLGPKTDA